MPRKTRVAVDLLDQAADPASMRPRPDAAENTLADYMPAPYQARLQ